MRAAVFEYYWVFAGLWALLAKQMGCWAAGRLVLLARIILLLCVLLEGRADEIQGGGMPGLDRRAPSLSDLIIFCYYLFIFFKKYIFDS